MNKSAIMAFIYSFSFMTSFYGLAQDLDEQPHRPLVILFDYDGTLAALAPGQATNTPEGKRLLNFNEELIQLGANAQQQGAVCLGFTNWFSMNYAPGGYVNYDNCPGRVRITEGCKSRGLQLNQVVVTHSFLYAFEKLSTQAEANSMELGAYIKTLSLEERLSILGSYYREVITKEEREYCYDNGSIGSRKNHAEIHEVLKAEEKRLNAYRNKAIEFGLGNPARLLGREIVPGEQGMDKFQLIEIVLLLLPEFDIVVFDDKIEVIDTCAAVAKLDNEAVTGLDLLQVKGRDVKGLHVFFTQQGCIFEENILFWYKGLSLIDAQNDCLNSVKKDCEYLDDAQKNCLNNLRNDFLKKVNDYKNNETNLNKLTESSINLLKAMQSNFTGFWFDSSIEKNIKKAIDNYIDAFKRINLQYGTGVCKYMIETTNALLIILNNNKAFVENKCGWNEDSKYDDFVESLKNDVKTQITINPIHNDLTNEQKNKFLTMLGFSCNSSR